METVGLAFDFISVLRGCVGGVVGTEDFDVSRMRKAVQMVVYDFGTRQAAQDAAALFKATTDARYSDVERHFAPADTIVLGEGRKPKGVHYPMAYIAIAPTEFRHDPLIVFERMVDIIEREAWGEHPELRSEPRSPRRPAPEPAGEGRPARNPWRLKHLGRADPLNMELDVERSYTPPSFKVPVRGYDRRIKPTSKGRDRHGNVIYGSVYVGGYDRYKDLPDRPSDEG